MKNILKGLVVLLILLFAPSLCLSASYPPQIAKKFRHAAPLIDCKITSPTNIHLRFYTSENATWEAFVLGREGKDLLIFFARPENNSRAMDIYRTQ